MRLNPYAAVEKNLARIMQAKGIARKAEKLKRIEVKVGILHSWNTSIEILFLRIWNIVWSATCDTVIGGELCIALPMVLKVGLGSCSLLNIRCYNWTS